MAVAHLFVGSGLLAVAHVGLLSGCGLLVFAAGVGVGGVLLGLLGRSGLLAVAHVGSLSGGGLLVFAAAVGVGRRVLLGLLGVLLGGGGLLGNDGYIIAGVGVAAVLLGSLLGGGGLLDGLLVLGGVVGVVAGDGLLLVDDGFLLLVLLGLLASGLLLGAGVGGGSGSLVAGLAGFLDFNGGVGIVILHKITIR